MRINDIDRLVRIGEVYCVPLHPQGIWRMETAFDQGLMIDIQAAYRRTGRQFGKNRASAATHLEDSLCVPEAGFFKDVGPKLACPVCLLGVAGVPVHIRGG